MTATRNLPGLDVSRETLSALQAYESLVQRWNTAINLVSKGTLADFWMRHVVDSAQVFTFCPEKAQTWVDLGSGAGLPGLVVAIIARELRPGLRVTLVESDLRKATFLRQAAQALELCVTVLSQRIESVPALSADVVSARALAPLADLLGFADQHLARDGVAIFPKGARYETEVVEARKAWSFDVVRQPSHSDAEAALLVIRNIRRAQD
ncbi:16S rRNA (guanine(527)-N(7))-methyltransferase RsmG [Rhodobacter calidifons]|uniref:Ribosomal RNA small subunit methyltransferase G n=1 Tax=Rhodobacter calidifons TaxID=2715277 RepID=A0ABX0G3H0_9RHOB|nr:16S rRNA (guanine(527)-N(7))-methyltransferase RsmG [Rhodobacter calidifons]NHB75664.1 16S rRNA (guanine(527)-N(7))-methyltransferase RsmG [Rhodobacter calidifons]